MLCIVCACSLRIHHHAPTGYVIRSGISKTAMSFHSILLNLCNFETCCSDICMYVRINVKHRPVLSTHCANSAETCDSSFTKIKQICVSFFLRKGFFWGSPFLPRPDYGGDCWGYYLDLCFSNSGSLALYITIYIYIYIYIYGWMWIPVACLFCTLYIIW